MPTSQAVLTAATTSRPCSRPPASKPINLPHRRATTLQSSPAPTQARHCNAAACPKKPVPKISTRSRREAAARRPRRPRPPPEHCRSPPLQAPQDLTTRKVFGRPPQRTRREPKKWPRRHLNPYENGAAPPSASRPKRGAPYQGAPRDHEPRVIVRGRPKNAL